MRFVEREGLSSDSIEALINKQGKSTVSYNGNPSRRHLFQAYGRKCCYCESPITNFEVDHFWPQEKPNLKFKFLKNLKIDYSEIVDDVRNWHLACSRCNKNKSNFFGRMLSPNYFFSIRKNDWVKVSESFIKKIIWYDGAYAHYSRRYRKFFDKLELNGKETLVNTDISRANAATYSAILQWRIEYLEETKQLILLLAEITVNKVFSDVSALQGIVNKRFMKDAPFSSMIRRNCIKAYCDCLDLIKKHGLPIDIDKIKSQL